MRYEDPYKNMESLEWDDYFEKMFKKHTAGREEHEFNFYSIALGKQIYGKEHYKRELKRKRLVPYEEAERLAEQWDKDHPKPKAELSPKARDIINSVRLTVRPGGYVEFGGRLIKALKENGLLLEDSQYKPDGDKLTGGFDNAS